jgi:hypothetical protein
VEIPDLIAEEAQFQMFDQAGRLIHVLHKSASEPLQHIRWDLSTLPGGLYFIQVKHDSGTIVRKLVK